jgi:peptide/nickel transport system permease protein
VLIYILRRLALSVSVVFAAIVATFAIFFLGPSDPAGAFCGQGQNCTPERVAIIKKSLGLDEPKTTQFVHYIEGVVVGRDIGDSDSSVKHCPAPCLGWSYRSNRPVTDMVLERFPVTLSLVVGGVAVYVTLALLFGVLAARFRGRLIDRVIVGVSQFVPAIPYYIAALMFYLYFMVFYAIIPRSSYTSITESPWAWFTGLLGVWLFWGAFASTGYIRYVRASMIDTQGQDYVRTARSKGISEKRVMYRHALRAAIAPFITLVGISIAFELTGSIFTERIFNIQGMGLLALDSFNTGDLPVIAGVVVITATFVTIGNLIVDMLYGVVDPRVKLS